MAEKEEYCLSTRSAARISPRSMFLMKAGMFMWMGQPSRQVGLAQSMQRRASSMAISSVKPWATSWMRSWVRVCMSTIGMAWRLRAMRSLFFIDLRNSSRQAAPRSVSSSMESFSAPWPSGSLMVGCSLSVCSRRDSLSRWTPICSSASFSILE